MPDTKERTNEEKPAAPPEPKPAETGAGRSDDNPPGGYGGNPEEE